jgi:NAD+ synthase (glutamine-hydrolysing)
MRTALGDPAANAQAALDIARECNDEGVAVAVFPELALTGYSLDDILMQDTLLDAVEDAIQRITQASVEVMPVLVIGAPLRYLHRIYNTAVVIHRGRVLGIATKSYLPTYREFYELRQMAAGDDICDEIRFGRWTPRVRAPLGPDLLFAASDLPGFTLHVEICEDMWIPVPPSAHAALNGATVLANLSGSPATIGRAEDRCLLARSASLRCVAAYVYAAAGEGESTTDLAWDGHTMIWQNGVSLAQAQRFPDHAGCCIAEVDLDRLASMRQRIRIFDANREHHRRNQLTFRKIEFALAPETSVGR